MTTLKDKLIEYQQLGNKIMYHLKSLIMVEIDNDLTEEEWEILADIIIYTNDSMVSSIEFRDTNISQ